MQAYPSALKHVVSAEDGANAAEHSVFVADIDDDNAARQLRLGFDPDVRLVELRPPSIRQRDELLIHAMKAGPQYLDLLP